MLGYPSMRLRTITSGVLILASLHGCSEAGPTGPCKGNVDITVTSGLTPTFRWTPSCSIGSLTVERLEANGGRSPQWMTSDAHNSIRPGIGYGSRNDNPATALQTGATYQVRIGTLECSVLDCVSTIVGVHDFAR